MIWAKRLQDITKPASLIFSPDEYILGHSYSEWLSLWWLNYNLSQRDRLKQPVFFVPGKIMESPKQSKIKSRYIVIKQDKPILFAILNWLAADHEDRRTDDELIQECKNRIDVVAENKQRFQIINDKTGSGGDISFLSSRSRSTFFTINKHKCLTEGYWLFLKPNFFAEKGDYSINSFGTCSSGKTQVEIDYHVFIR